MTLFASHELGCDIEGVRERMQDLVQVLPDLSKTIMLSQPPCAGRIFAITNAYDACVVKQATPSHSTICCFWFTSIAWCSGGFKLCCICTDISIPEKGLNQHICNGGMPSSSVHVHAGKKVHHMKPGLLAALLRDTHVIADRAVRLRELLPHTNVSAMAAKQPELLLQVIAHCICSYAVWSAC